jgi:putative DNA primase/helicase
MPGRCFGRTMICREKLISKLAPVVFDPQAACPTWEALLHRILAEDAELIWFFQKAVGYSLTGSIEEQCYFILYGGGSNGKSTAVNTISALLGVYARHTPTGTLLVKNSDAVRNDVARLQGARFVSAVEAEGGRKLAEALVKQLTGGDKVTARYLNHEHFEFEPAFKVWLAVNHKSIIRGTDHGTWRHIRLIPFKVTIPNGEQDKSLMGKLQAELRGILRWAVEGGPGLAAGGAETRLCGHSRHRGIQSGDGCDCALRQRALYQQPWGTNRRILAPLALCRLVLPHG